MTPSEQVAADVQASAATAGRHPRRDTKLQHVPYDQLITTIVRATQRAEKIIERRQAYDVHRGLR